MVEAKRASRRSSVIAACALASTVLLRPTIVRADIGPPEGYVEKCSIEKQCAGEGTTCEAFHGTAEAACAKKAADRGLVETCTTWGGAHSTAVFCPKAPTAKVARGCGGCSASRTEGSTPVSLVVIVLALGVVVHRTRRRER